mgnify:CR=1 FL=1
MKKYEEISISEMLELKSDEYVVIDIRDDIAFTYGTINGAVNIPQNQLKERLDTLPTDKLLIICCKSGIISDPVAENLRKHGFNAANLKEGYYGYMLANLKSGNDRAKDVERSINKKFHKGIWSKFTAAINDYQLVEEGDKIAVCISGGKDSMLMAKLLQELQRHGKYPFELVFLVMNPGYNADNWKIIQDNAKVLGIPLTVFESDIFNIVAEVDKNPCYLCARMRRGYLYSHAKELGCNKIALGHHFDDVIETVLMGMLYSGKVETMMPKLHSKNFEGMELIRPLYMVKEADIEAWRDYHQLHFIQCACKFTDTCTTCNNEENQSKRMEIKKLIAELKKTNPFVEGNIFKSVENVNLDTVVAYKSKGMKHHFLDTYDRKEEI